MNNKPSFIQVTAYYSCQIGNRLLTEPMFAQFIGVYVSLNLNGLSKQLNICQIILMNEIKLNATL